MLIHGVQKIPPIVQVDRGFRALAAKGLEDQTFDRFGATLPSRQSEEQALLDHLGQGAVGCTANCLAPRYRISPAFFFPDMRLFPTENKELLGFPA